MEKNGPLLERTISLDKESDAYWWLNLDPKVKTMNAQRQMRVSYVWEGICIERELSANLSCTCFVWL